jgi:hypothetical protein
MENLKFSSPEELLGFYFSQGYFALHYCENESGEIDISHYVLLRSGEQIGPECLKGEIYDLNDPYTLELIQRFLQTGQVIIHPRKFKL